MEKKLATWGTSREELGREKFIERMWGWKDESRGTIIDQLQSLGCSCDWSRTRFTMDAGYQKAVEDAFFHYQKKGWIYQGERVINWCARCRTSLSDLELEHEEEKGKLWFIRYPLANKENNGYIVVATTRPETMLGDTAVAVNPKDKRYKDLIGGRVVLPIQNKTIPIISDRRIEIDFGTGAVKVTPAHDMLDEQIGLDHKLAAPKVIGEDGRMAAEAGKNFKGLKISEAREKVVKMLDEAGLIEKVEDYTHNIARCYRCGSTIEPLRSKQWFLKMDELAKMAIKDVKTEKIKFHPEKWEKIYFDWLKNIKDWCISRQIWWGHKIPVEEVDDVLDTWFSSALWPFAALGLPRAESRGSDLKNYYPTQVLSTARDIINLWVARMVFSSEEFLGKPPFSDVIIHATILAKDGRRMSKSLGTGVDPMTLIEKYGADATRFGLVWQAMGGQDIKWAEEHIVAGKKFCNKIWNAARFVLQNKNLNTNKKTHADKKILSQLKKIQKQVSKLVDKYEFGQALHILYDFFWHDFCDVYLEESKKNPNAEVLSRVLKESLKLLHPFMPFITERIWREFSEKGRMLMIEPWKS